MTESDVDNVTISVRQAVDFLNGLLDIDPNFINNLIMTRFKCNDKLTYHPSVQHLTNPEMTGAYAGFLGVLNGMFGIDDKGSALINICVKDGKLLTFVSKDQKFDFDKVGKNDGDE